MSKILLILLTVASVLALQKGWLKPDWSVIVKDSGLPLPVPPSQPSAKPCPAR
ncbi:hypothetical protein [Cyanobium sp. Morenito 9A2]|uniref:hypothetical protein n=1 Tax=Cyanobium sp. Morenito 9A2 TaxID=2823718 RepID=UPI0020CF027B|nr:hypothetical protein [Cyanobium sp. Morenito 9A2]MCP9848614.1 hypothetical protein [Cyanobium sp. Morenito 9A2]